MPAPPRAAVEIEGLQELQRAIRKSVDTDLPKRLGQAHKEIGQLVIDRLQPRPDPMAVGAGAGASVRPSASKREVLLRVGGKHRDAHAPLSQWGKRTVGRVGRHAPKRPYIKKSAEGELDDIGRLYLEAIARAMDPAFAKTEP